MKTNKVRKPIAAILAVLMILMVLPSYALFAANDNGEGQIPVPAAFDISRHQKLVNVPEALEEGQIWTEKQVEIIEASNREEESGQFKITLYAWGKQFTDDDGDKQYPLAKDEEGKAYITITDEPGNWFSVADPENLPDGVLIDSTGVVTWVVEQQGILGKAPATVSFVVELKEGWDTGIKYYTNKAATASFTPVKGNPFYFTTETKEKASLFIDGVNWNNGNGTVHGINTIRITDYDLDLIMHKSSSSSDNFAVTGNGSRTFTFDSTHTVNSYVFTSSGNEKDDLARLAADVSKAAGGAKDGTWGVLWDKGGGTDKTYYIWFMGLVKPGVLTVYNINPGNNGGSDGEGGSRWTIYKEYNHIEGFHWVGETDEINDDLPNKGWIRMAYVAYTVYLRTWFSDEDGDDGSYQIYEAYKVLKEVGRDSNYNFKDDLPDTLIIDGIKYNYDGYEIDYKVGAAIEDGYELTYINGDIHIDRYYKQITFGEIEVEKIIESDTTLDSDKIFTFELYIPADENNEEQIIDTQDIVVKAGNTSGSATFDVNKDVLSGLRGYSILWIREVEPESIFDADGVWAYDEDGLNGKANVRINADGSIQYSTNNQDWDNALLSFVNGFDTASYGVTVKKAADTSEAEVGDNILYAVTVTNDGNMPLTGITLVDSLMGGDLLSEGSDVYDDADLANKITEFAEYKTLGVGDSYTIYYAYTVKANDPNNLVNTVTVDTNETDPTSDSKTVEVLKPLLSVEKQIRNGRHWSDSAILTDGSTALYMIIVRNDGDANATGLSLSDMLTSRDLTGFSEELTLKGKLDPTDFGVAAGKSAVFFASAELEGMKVADTEADKLELLADIADKEIDLPDLRLAVEVAREALDGADNDLQEAYYNYAALLDDEDAIEEELDEALAAIDDAKAALGKAFEDLGAAEAALAKAETGLQALYTALANIDSVSYSSLSYTNTVTLYQGSDEVDNDTAEAEVMPELQSGLHIRKEVKDQDDNWTSLAVLESGSQAEFKITVTNTGNTTITADQIVDYLDEVEQDLDKSSIQELAPGGFYEIFYTIPVPENDSTAESKVLVNVAILNEGDEDEISGEAVVIIPAKPAALLDISKKVWAGAGKPTADDDLWMNSALRYVDDEDATADFYFKVTVSNEFGQADATIDLHDLFDGEEVILLDGINGSEIVMDSIVIEAGETETFYFTGNAEVGVTDNIASFTTDDAADIVKDESTATVNVVVNEKVSLSVEKTVARLLQDRRGNNIPPRRNSFEKELTISSNEAVQFVYKITVTNGSRTAGYFDLADVLEDGTTPNVYRDLQFKDEVTNLDHIRVGGHRSVTFYVPLTLEPGQAMTNTATITGSRDGSEGIKDIVTEDESSATAKVEEHPVLSIAKYVQDAEGAWVGRTEVYSNDEQEFTFKVVLTNEGPVAADVTLADSFGGRTGRIDITSELRYADGNPIASDGSVTVPANNGSIELYYTGKVPSGKAYVNDIVILDPPFGTETSRANAAARVQPFHKAILSVEKLAAFRDDLREGKEGAYAHEISRISPTALEVVYKIIVTNSGRAAGQFTLADILQTADGATTSPELFTDEACSIPAQMVDGSFTVAAKENGVNGQTTFYAKATFAPGEDAATAINTVTITGVRDGLNEENTEDIIENGESEAIVNYGATPFATLSLVKKVLDADGLWVDEASFEGDSHIAEFKITVSLDITAILSYNESILAYNAKNGTDLPITGSVTVSGSLTDIMDDKALALSDGGQFTLHFDAANDEATVLTKTFSVSAEIAPGTFVNTVSIDEQVSASFDGGNGKLVLGKKEDKATIKLAEAEKVVVIVDEEEEEDPVVTNTDTIYYVPAGESAPVAEIPEAIVPLASAVDVIIPDEEDYVIVDEEVPLGNLPQTGSKANIGAGLVGLVAALLSTAAAGVSIFKKEEEDF